jgi:hypothetical protein
MDNSQLRTYIRQLIIEAKEAKAKKTGKPELKTKKKVTVSDHIKMIEEAGEEAGKQAKTAEIEKIMDAIKHIKSTIDGLEHFDKVVGASTVKSLTADLENSLKELTKKKEELTKQAKNKEASIQTENKPKAPSQEETAANQVYESRFKKVIKKK